MLEYLHSESMKKLVCARTTVTTTVSVSQTRLRGLAAIPGSLRVSVVKPASTFSPVSGSTLSGISTSTHDASLLAVSGTAC